MGIPQGENYTMAVPNWEESRYTPAVVKSVKTKGLEHTELCRLAKMECRRSHGRREILRFAALAQDHYPHRIATWKNIRNVGVRAISPPLLQGKRVRNRLKRKLLDEHTSLESFLRERQRASIWSRGQEEV